MEVSARLAVAADVDVVDELVRAARDAVAGERGGEQWLATVAPEPPGDADLGAGERRWLVGCVDDVPVGVAATSVARWADGRVVHRIDVLFVEPGAREVGVGEALVDAVVVHATTSGASAVEGLALPGQRELKNLFERVGLVARAIVAHRRLT